MNTNNIIDADILFNTFKCYFPTIAVTAVEWFQIPTFGYGNDQLIIILNDGDRILFDNDTASIRTLPKDPNNLSETEFRKEFGIRLKQILKYKRVTQLELAEAIGTTQRAICLYANGKSTPTMYTVDKIAKYLDCSVDCFRYTIPFNQFKEHSNL